MNIMYWLNIGNEETFYAGTRPRIHILWRYT
jgi:hypothetical protein